VNIVEKDFKEVSLFINQELDTHTASIFGAPIPPQKKFALELVVDGEVRGAVSGTLTTQNFHVNGLVVIGKYRGLDYGSQLLIAIEARAIEAGAKVLTVSTQCFQALDFYKKHGYEVFGELKDVPFEGVTKYYLSKRVHTLK